MAQYEFDNLRTKVETLETKIEGLENIIKKFMRDGKHTHDWEYIGCYHNQNQERICMICNQHDVYVYPGRPYEDMWKDIDSK